MTGQEDRNGEVDKGNNKITELRTILQRKIFGSYHYFF
jgi:hypothetical protein